MIELHNYSFTRQSTERSYSRWAIRGQVYNHPEYPDGSWVFTSSPREISLDLSGNPLILTYSGREYRLVNPNGDKGEILSEINRCIKAGGYRRIC